MSDYDMSDHVDALDKLAVSLRRKPHEWSDAYLVQVMEAAKWIAGRAESIRLERALGGQ